MMFRRNSVHRWAKAVRRKFTGLGPGESGTCDIAFVILVDDEVHNLMRRLQFDLLKRYGMNYGLKASPHISLKLGFEVGAIEPYVDFLDGFARNVRPFEIRIDGVDRFEEGIIFMEVKQDQRLEELRQKLLGDLYRMHGVKPYPIEGSRFHFHATLAHDMSKDDFEKAFRELKTIRVEHRFELDNISLLCNPEGQWITYKIVRLK